MYARLLLLVESWASALFCPLLVSGHGGVHVAVHTQDESESVSVVLLSLEEKNLISLETGVEAVNPRSWLRQRYWKSVRGCEGKTNHVKTQMK